MAMFDQSSNSLRRAIYLALSGAGLALTTQTVIADDAESQELEEVVVTGFRGSLNTALSEKRNSTAAIDSIVAEDIGKFPDSNLAESMQRIPGVTLSRGDGGEGRNISVRGLAPQFTRVRINGMEAASQGGSSDIYGAGNNGRTFDFNLFPTEIFSELAVRKTPSADVEEGSLGATVDLNAPRPFDYPESTVFSVTTRGVYNEISEDVDPRASMLASKKFFDDKFGVLMSVAYQKRNIREVGYSAVDILPTSASANNIGTAAAPIFLPFCTPIGWTTTGASPVPGSRGATATNCSTNNPRTSDLTAFNTVYNLVDESRRDAAGRLIPGSGAFFPRLPRYVNSEQDTQRTGGTLTLQWAPTEDTTIALDGLMSKYEVERRDNYILGLSLGRTITNNGQPMVSVQDVAFDNNGSVEYAVLDGMDVRSEGLVDQFTMKFEQINLDIDHRFSDNFKITALAGRSISRWDGPMRLQTFIDRIDTPDFTLDFRGGRETPLIGFGFDVSNPNLFTYAPTPDGNQTVLGGFSTQGKPSENITTINTYELSGDWQMSDMFSMQIGGQYRENDFNSHASNLQPAFVPVTALPAGVTLESITTHIRDLDDKFGSGAPASWVAVDSKKWRDAFNFPDAYGFCGTECGAGKSEILEEVKSGYLMFKFDSGDSWGIPIRGDVGVRYVKTDQTAVGYIPVAAPMGAPYPNVGQRNEVVRSYADTLPAFNVVFELMPDLLARLSGSKVMTRPELGNLTPTATVTATTQNAVINNPFLEPIRAKTADLSLEWYFKPGSLLSVAYFYKDIETYIQRITTRAPYNTLGLPDSLLAGTPSSPTDLFNVTRQENTPGGPLKGFEINAQVQFDFLEGWASGFGVLANYTHVESEIEYLQPSQVVQPPAGSPPGTPPTFITPDPITNDLIGLSPDSASGTLFYENDRFSIRATASFRDAYIRAIPANVGSDLQGNKKNTFVDAQAAYHFNDNFSMLFEAQNLTGERNTLYIDSVRQDTLFQTEIGTTYSIGAIFKF